ncbi:MAG: DUF11 domain-containing protein [Gemmataceae bacterium]|nr:DUF11 domain-containing protein [Gemmataceae bacterium]
MGRIGRWAAVGVLGVGLAGGAASGLAGHRPAGGPPDAPPVEFLPYVGRSTAPAAEPPKPAAAVALTWAHPAEVRVNRPAAYTLTVTNTGPEPVQRVVVQVRVPAGVTASDAEPAAQTVGGVLLWDLGTLAAGEAKPLAVSFASPARGPLTAEAWVTCTGTAATTVPVREPKLEAFIEAPATVEIGRPIPVKYGVRNTGDTRLDNVIDALSPTHPGPKLLRVSSTYTKTPPGGTGYSVEPGEARTDEVNEPADRVGVVTFDYAVTAADGLKATATAKVKVLSPRLKVSVTGPAELGVGKAGTYTVTVTNTGDLAAEELDVRAEFPAGLTGGRPEPTDPLVFVGPDTPEVRQAQYTEQTSRLSPGATRRYVVDARAAAPGAHLGKVFVTGKQGLKAAAECRTVVTGVPGIRMEVVDSTDPLKVGDETTYEVKVLNTGTEADRNLKLVCDVPAGLEVVKAGGPVGHAVRLHGRIIDEPADPPVRDTVTFDPVRELGPKTEAVFKVTVRATAAGAAKFTARLTSDHLTTPVVKEESTTVYGD